MQSAKTRPGADCGSDYELHFALNQKNYQKLKTPELTEETVLFTPKENMRKQVSKSTHSILPGYEVIGQLSGIMGVQVHPQEKEMQKGKMTF